MRLALYLVARRAVAGDDDAGVSVAGDQVAGRVTAATFGRQRPADLVPGCAHGNSHAVVALASAAEPSWLVPMKLPATWLSVVPSSLIKTPPTVLPEMRLLRSGTFGAADHVLRRARADGDAHSVGERRGAILVGADEVALHQVAGRPGACDDDSSDLVAGDEVAGRPAG